MKPILDRSGKVIALENDVSPYRKEIRDRSNALLASYNPKINQTFDRSGKMVGTGDQRARLIRDE
jgi:hypothetical protein